jgi:hypothetical protein
VDIDNFEKVWSKNGTTKYRKPGCNEYVYTFEGYSNDPVLHLTKINEEQWVSRLETNGSFSQMKASMDDFDRALRDGKRLLKAFAQ